MQCPLRIGLRAKRIHRYGPATRTAGGTHDDLHLDAVGGRQQQRRRQRQLLDHGTTDLITGPQRQLHEPGPREQHHPGDRVVGQPRLRRQRQPAGQHHRTGIGPLHHRAQQAVLGPAKPNPPRSLPPTPTAAARIVAAANAYVGNVDVASAGERRAPIHRHTRDVGLARGQPEPVQPAVVAAQRRNDDAHRRGCGRRRCLRCRRSTPDAGWTR